MTSREEFRKYRSASHKQEINIHGGTYSDVPTLVCLWDEFEMFCSVQQFSVWKVCAPFLHSLPFANISMSDMNHSECCAPPSKTNRVLRPTSFVNRKYDHAHDAGKIAVFSKQG